MAKLEIGLADESKLSFEQFFQQLNVKKKIYAKSSSRFKFKCRILTTASLNG